MIVKFKKYRLNPRELEVKTKILAIYRHGDEVEIEFEKEPASEELIEIARRLRMKVAEVGVKNSKLKKRRVEILELRKRMEEGKKMLKQGHASRGGEVP